MFPYILSVPSFILENTDKTGLPSHSTSAGAFKLANALDFLILL